MTGMTLPEQSTASDLEAVDCGHRDDPEIQRVISVAKAYYQVEPVVMPTSPGTGPMATIYAALQAPIASLGVGYANNLDHAPNEHIRLVDYDQHIDAVKALIKSYQASQLKE